MTLKSFLDCLESEKGMGLHVHQSLIIEFLPVGFVKRELKGRTLESLDELLVIITELI